jgi:hypothetical protein
MHGGSRHGGLGGSDATADSVHTDGDTAHGGMDRKTIRPAGS